MGEPSSFPWLAVALRVVSNPCSNALQKALGAAGWPAPVLLALTHGLLGPVAMVILLGAGDALGWEFWRWSLASAVLAVAANWLILEAVRRSDLSLLGPVNAYKPWVSLLPSWFLLGELPRGADWAGMGLVLLGSVVLGGGASGASAASGAPGRSWGFLADRGVQLRLLALVVSSAEAVTLRRAVAASDASSAFAAWVLLGFLVVAPFAWRARGACPPRDADGAWRLLPAGLALAFTTGLMQSSTLAVLDRLSTGVALSFFQLSSVLSVFIGRAFFREARFVRRLAGACVMSAGAVVMVLAR
jgi:drug/metabolite transporter (DMT)-like permease